MRKLTVNAFVTLDGVMQAPGGPEEDPSGGFAYGGWSVPWWDDVMAEASAADFQTPFDIVLGRKTYEIFAAHWPYDEGPIADTLNAARKYVASNTLASADWQNSTVLSGDVPAQIRDLKEQDGPELRVLGSANLIQTLNAHGLVDEYGLWISPVIVGKGKRVFGDDLEPASLELFETKTSTTGVLLNRYRKTGPVETGSFASEEPSEAEVERRERMAHS